MELIQSLKNLSSIEFSALYKSTADEQEQKALLWARCATDRELFTLHYFPHYCTDPFNEFHYDCFDSFDLGKRGIRRARGAPRGAAKSTHKALIEVLHDISYGLERYILIISNTAAQTVQKLRDIREEIRGNTDLAAAYGLSFPAKKVNELEYIVHAGNRRIKVQGFSAGSQVRGVRYGPHRPSKIILDDVEHSEEVFNESLRAKRRQWYQEDVVKAGNKYTNVEFLGTVLHRESLLKELLQNPMYDSRCYKSFIEWPTNTKLWDEWKKILTNLDDPERLAHSDAFYEKNRAAMDAGAKVLWPEREPPLFLMKELVEIGRRSFMKEKQNEPMGAEDKVFYHFEWYREETRNGVQGALVETSGAFVPFTGLECFGAMDPSTGQKKAKKGALGDFSCIVTGYAQRLRDHRRLFVHHDWTRREPPTKYIEEIFHLHQRYKYEKFGVETNLYRNLLLPNILAERDRLNRQVKGDEEKIRIQFYDIEAVDSKEKRIYTLEPKVTHGWILLNRALSQEFINQLDDFPHADHDDCPDALEMLWGLVNDRYGMVPVNVNPFAGR